jgi:hypothetical protein
MQDEKHYKQRAKNITAALNEKSPDKKTIQYV